MSLARASRQYLGVRALLPPDLQYALRNPTSSDKAYVKGTLWLNTADATAFMWPGSGNWIALGSGTSGAIVTLTGGSGGALSPTAGNMNLLGTANQINSVGSGSTITFSLSATLVAPGTIASTTTITAGTALIATTSVTSGTSITATLGNITATNGNIVKGTAGNKDVYTSVATNGTAGANSAGTVTLVGGTATVSTTAVTANSLIRLYRQSVGATGAAATGNISRGTITPGTSFVINSVAAADATALATTDVSVVFWEIVN